MDKKTFKYASEFAVLMYLDTYQILQQTELELYGKTQTAFSGNNPCNIYFILRRPKLSIDPNYCIKGKGYYELKYFIHEQDKRHERKFRTKINTDEYDFYTQYPYNYFSLVNKKNQDLNCHYKLAVIVDAIHEKSDTIEPLLDLEVLYIGQAFGEDGNRTAIDRLGSHSTLQKIYSEAMQRNPDSEIWILLASFQQKNISTMNGMITMSQSNEKEDFNRWMNFNNGENPFSDKQKINFTEAALIRTFLPQYNKEYKDTFPNPAHSSYSECYSLDLNAIVVEMDMTEARRWLYSDSKKRGIDKEGFDIPYWQYGQFYFINDEERYKIFNYEYLGKEKNG
ncbi:MAG: hypothetical protein U0V72_05135 [Cytophagales bacterium]